MSDRRILFGPLEISGMAKEDDTVLDVARRIGAPIGSSCGGTGVCRRCKILVISGRDQLNERSWIEDDDQYDDPLGPEERLACQAIPRGPVVVTTTYWRKPG